MKKKVDIAFGKKQYLLGQKDGIYYWLEEAKWECDWYWGLGYVETFTNNKNPRLAVDIKSHSHILMFFQDRTKNGYDSFKEFFDETVLSDKELWTFIECMKSLYTLREYSDFLHRGGSYYTSNPCKELIMNNAEYERINKELIPALLNKVYSLLSDKETDKEV